MPSEAEHSAGEYRQTVNTVVEALEEKKADAVTAIDVSGLTSFTDAMVIASAGSIRHAKALADYILEVADRENFSFLGMEGYAQGQWILLDLNDVLVHIFQPAQRQMFDLEGLWSEAKVLHAPPADR